MLTRRGDDDTPAGAKTSLTPAKVFQQGFITNAFNPKVALFFLAFLPQFIDSNAPSKALAFVFLGIVFNVNGTLWNLGVAWATARGVDDARRQDVPALDRLHHRRAVRRVWRQAGAVSARVNPPSS
jgi:threonine/homoserine/homoserine lactone efflux protein